MRSTPRWRRPDHGPRATGAPARPQRRLGGAVLAVFFIAVMATSIGIWALPDDGWVKGFLAMGLLFTVGASLSLAKTVRDLHEATRMAARFDEARVSRLIAEHDPLKPAV